MVRGGRGGEVRLKLYLCLDLVATKSPYRLIGMPARLWAEMLSLPDPEGRGARRVSDALDWLDAHKLVAVERHRGAPPDITLLNPAGDGEQYHRPMKRWVKVPLPFWTQQWITALSGRATAIFLVLLDMQGGRPRTNPPWLSAADRTRYSLSADTWTRGTHELVDKNLLTVKRTPQGRDFDWRRLRNTYWIEVEQLENPAT
jgi:hypothetical protein